MKRLMLATMLIVAATSVVLAQAPAADDPHHPPQGAATPAPAQPTPPAAQPGMGGMNMMGGMPMMNMMQMMQMMQMMRMMGPGMAGIDHVEGRIAFLRTELKITEAQTSAWNVFADALRTKEARRGARSMMRVPGSHRLRR
jgi:hypothetical protein